MDLYRVLLLLDFYWAVVDSYWLLKMGPSVNLVGRSGLLLHGSSGPQVVPVGLLMGLSGLLLESYSVLVDSYIVLLDC